MKRLTLITSCISLICVLFLSGYNNKDISNSENEQVYIVPGDCSYDFSGIWIYSTSNHQVTGMCPSGKDSKGKCRVIQDGNNIKLEFLSGMTCSPPSMCEYKGSCEGNIYIFKNSAVVDDEGGKVTNTITVTVGKDGTAKGNDVSTYSVSGFNCEWSFDISLKKEE